MSTLTVRIILYSSTLQLLNEPLVHLHCSSCTLQAHFRSLYLNVLYNVLHTRLSQTMTTFPKFNPNRPSVTCRMHVHVPLEPSDFTECLSRQVHVPCVFHIYLTIYSLHILLISRTLARDSPLTAKQFHSFI